MVTDFLFFLILTSLCELLVCCYWNNILWWLQVHINRRDKACLVYLPLSAL